MARLVPLGAFCALVAISSLTACAADQASEASLADSKVSVQLLRLDTLTRIPVEYISEIVSTNDIPEPCGDGDPNLRWVSSSSARFTSGATDQVTGVYDELIASFIERGWTTKFDSEGTTQLTSDASIATVEIEQHLETTPRSVDVLVTGPCLLTSGLDSPEVEVLQR